ncbi:unnamed protein product [Mytilus edulis]|uniref:DDE Tnp4 domain-containing protein n=1 Tax=Mytilus edulis TaxID=6550 RepID=A0A8S3RJV6_MYTED|nr:unnamed protein product [Mytilus edulis]
MNATPEYVHVETQVGHTKDVKDIGIQCDLPRMIYEDIKDDDSKWLTWSEYNHHNTFKILIGVTPNGMVTFVSRLWGGNVSDRHIVEHDGLIPKLSPGDVIMADKGFTIEDLLSPDIGLNVPPRVSTKHQMSSSEFFKTSNVAAARIVIEMKMEQVKIFQIFNSILSLPEAHLAEQIAIICISWTNFFLLFCNNFKGISNSIFLTLIISLVLH